MFDNIDVMKGQLEQNKDKNYKPSIQGVTGDRKGERLLALSLPALVSGTNATGRKFKETTEIISISSKLACFRLKTPVSIGNSVKLILNIPATTFLLHPLRLEVSGIISRIEINGDKKFSQVVTIELDRRFQLGPLNPSTGN
ncbi:MAG: hypothetical protein ACPLZD_06980 [Candidatus Saccharicenans sp.]